MTGTAGREAFFEPRHAAIERKARSLARSLERHDEAADDDVMGASRAALKTLARAGLLRHVVPKAYGGTAPFVQVRSVAAARFGVAYGSGLADALLALQGLGSLPLTLFGNDGQRGTWLPRVARGDAVAGFAMTEPEAGSDAAAMTTRARATPRGWTITGTKTFISNAGLADFYTVFAKTDPAAGAKGVTAFLVPSSARGIKVEPLRTISPHPLGTLRFKDVRVPKDAVIGAQGQGFKVALTTLDLMRPTVAAAACGFAQRALDEAVRRTSSRRQFGRAIIENQGVRWKLAEAATDLTAARLLVERAAWLKDTGQDRITLESAQAKLFATEAAQRIVDLALQLHGGTGLLHGSVVERLYREVRALRIYEGTSEILRDVIARSLYDPA